MLESTIRPGVVAVVAGVLVAIVFAVPFGAVEYRRFGRLTPHGVLVGLAVAIYGCALATYTTLPLPDGQPSTCTRLQPVPFRFMVDVMRLGVGSPGAIVRNPALQQVLLNVVLFLPLGVFVRRFTGWRTWAVVALGLGVSLLIEATQLTGVWGLYRCSYRVPDVDDLLANSGGALLGALAAPLFGRRRPAFAHPEDRPRRVTLGRRFTGMLNDVIVTGLIGLLVSLVSTVPLAAADVRLPQPWNGVIGWAAGSLVPALVQLGFLLVSGQTIGEQTVRLQPDPRPSRPRLAVRWAVGIGGWALLSDVSVLGWLLVAASVVGLLATADRRGLAYAITGLRVRVSPPPTRVPRPAPEGPPTEPFME